MLSQTLISYENLQNWTGYTRKNDVIKWLNQNNIPYKLAKNSEPVTTLNAVSTAINGGISENSQDWNFA